MAVISFLPVALSMSTFPFARFDRPHRLPIFFKSLPKGGKGNNCAFRNGGGKGRLVKFGGMESPGGGNGPGGSMGIGKNGIGGFVGEFEFSLFSPDLPQFGIHPFFQPLGRKERGSKGGMDGNFAGEGIPARKERGSNGGIGGKFDGKGISGGGTIGDGALS